MRGWIVAALVAAAGCAGSAGPDVLPGETFPATLAGEPSGPRPTEDEMAAVRELRADSLPPACDPQPWSADEAPYTEDDFLRLGVTPPAVLTSLDDLHRAGMASGLDPFRDLIPGERAQAIHQILVAPDGSKALIQLAATTGNDRVDEAGLFVARTLRFRPATRFGCAVLAWYEFPFRMARNE